MISHWIYGIAHPIMNTEWTFLEMMEAQLFQGNYGKPKKSELLRKEFKDHSWLVVQQHFSSISVCDGFC